MTAAAPRHDQRHQSREMALQVLYQSEIARVPVDDALEAFDKLESPPRQTTFAAWLVRGTAAHLDEIDPLITGSAQHWRLSRMAVIDRLIIRLAVFELLYADDTPPAVVINEALELARTFSADEAVAFINGVLDDIRRRLDAGERSPVG